MPLVPLIPALSIVLNFCLMLKLSYLTWVRFTIWLLMGESGAGLGHWEPASGGGGQWSGG